MNEGSDRLGNYRKRRDFTKTPEPKGGEGNTAGGIFVVQKHSARALHYDLRLELDGALKSWAIPKGPSLDPADKRLSIHVEDHPIEYAVFEGVIPKGEYGAGKVILWDRGFWIPFGDPHEGYRKGELKFILAGRKLRGAWALVRLKKQDDEKDEWMLIKETDAEARRDFDITSEALSVLSGLAIDEIAEDRGMWSSKETPPIVSETMPEINAVKAPMDGRLFPELAHLVGAPPSKGDWLFEIKYDGYRLLSRVEHGEVRLFTRNGNDWTAKFPSIVQSLSRLRVRSAWLDGEAVYLKPDGTTGFSELQNSLSLGHDEDLSYIIFDIVYYNGYDLKGVPLFERKSLLKVLLRAHAKDLLNVRFGDHFEGDGVAFFERACENSVEGVVAKARSSPYRQGRSREWLKIKCRLRQEFVIGGYTLPGGKKAGFGALLVGAHDEEGAFMYCGRVGTGFDEASLKSLLDEIQPLAIAGPPFANPPTGVEARDVAWVGPKLVIEVEFSEWTRDGILRQASFQGLRPDKDWTEVTIERPEQTEPPRIRLTNPERVFYPEEGITKRRLIKYYELVGEKMLRHIEGRPLTLVRCPEGYDRECFFQKHAEMSLPAGVERIPILEEGTVEDYMAVNSLEGLLWLAQMGTLEVHAWGSRTPKVEFPDRITFDMDPDASVTWERLVEGAFLLRSVLKELGIESFPKLTGGKGVHVVVPIEPLIDWNEAKAFAKALAEFVARGLPERFTSVMTKARRTGKIYIDYMRNHRGSTAIEPYSTRAKTGAPVAAPVSWAELGTLRADSFTVLNMAERIKGLKEDPWEGYFDIRQTITAGIRKKLGRSGLKFFSLSVRRLTGLRIVSRIRSFHLFYNFRGFFPD